VQLGRPVPPGKVLAIFDLGGGTLDVALIRNDSSNLVVASTGGLEDLGGLDIDALLVDHLGRLVAAQHPEVWASIDRPTEAIDRRHRQAFWDDVRAAKEMLSRTASAPVPVPGVSTALHLTRDELDRLATPLVQRAVDGLTETLRGAGLTHADLSDVFLVGGSSRVPLVGRLLHTRLGIAPTVLDQPELPVAEGALLDRSGRNAMDTPISGMPISGMPISGMPVSGMPVSGMPVSGMPTSPPAGGPGSATHPGSGPVGHGTFPSYPASAPPPAHSGPPQGHPHAGPPPSGPPFGAAPSSGAPSGGPPSGGAPSSGPPAGGSTAPGPPPFVPPGRVPPQGGPRIPVGMPGPQAHTGSLPAPPPYVFVGAPRAQPVARPMRPLPPRPKYRTWPIILLVFVMICGGCGGALYKAFWPEASFQPLGADTAITFEDLAADGVRKAFADINAITAVAQRADGSLEVARHALIGNGVKRVRTATAGTWDSVRISRDWVVAVAAPGGDGKRVAAFANGYADQAVNRTIGRDDVLLLRNPDSALPNSVELYWIQTANGTVRTLSIEGNGTVREGDPHRLPTGARPLDRPELPTDAAHFVDRAGKLWWYQGGAAPSELPTTIPADQPGELVEVTSTGDVLLAEKKTGYRLLSGANQLASGPADREPYWVGHCGDDPCVIDQRPGDPSSRELAVHGSTRTSRTPVPFAAPRAAVPLTDDYLLVPTVQDNLPRTVAIDGDGKAIRFNGAMIPVESDAVLQLSALSNAAEQVTLTGIDLGWDFRTKVGRPTIRSAGCAAAGVWLACPRADDFAVWQIRKD